MIGKQWQKVKKIFSPTKATPVNLKIESFGDKNVGNKFPDKKEQPLLKDESNIKTLQQNIIVPAQNLVEDNFSDSFLPQNIDSYKLIEKIGSGGMGDVYAAHDGELHRKVAVKLLPPEFTKSKERVQRFRQEAQAASKLNHPNIITIHKIGRTKQIHYMVTEFVDGSTLRELISRGMSIRQVLEIIIQVASALKSTHEAGIIHRDIKPENIMIRRDGLVKVLDFGLAKLIEPGNIDSLEITSFHTQAGQIIGTPNYMSPEQVEGEHIDARTDLFSLGSLLYECLTGKQAFDGASAPKILTQIVKFVPPFPSKFNSEVLPELDKVTLKLLKKNPADRYQTADEVISELNEIKTKLQGFEHTPVRNINWRANTSKLKFLYPLPGITSKFHAAFLLIPLIKNR
jgi:serine/threonine protein kinase